MSESEKIETKKSKKIKKEMATIVPEAMKPSNDESIFKYKLDQAVEWAKENPIQTIGLGLVGLMSFRSRAIRRTVIWAASSLLSSKAIKFVGEETVNAFDHEIKNLLSDDSQTEDLH